MWPRAGMAAQRAVLDVLHSGRWTVSAQSQRAECYERSFGETFKNFVGRRFGVPCASGTAALSIALQALDIGPGDEVVVPGMTWVACASAVVYLGALPVLVDIDAQSLCLSPEAVEQAIGPATKAILAVHMYSSRANLDRLQAICDRHGVALIEDASQAHGGRLESRRIGTFGLVSVFSFQQTKLLTCGEGGVVLTDDPTLYDRLQQLRADGRIYADQVVAQHFHGLLEKGDFMGRNLCLSDFQAAILLEGLERLDRENEHRRSMAAILDDQLQRLGGITLVRDHLEPANGRTFYKIPLIFHDKEMLKLGPERIARAMTAELHLPVSPLDRPLNVHPLYRPGSIPLVARIPDLARNCDPMRFSLPIATDAWHRCVALPHPCLLGGEPEIKSIVLSLRKIIRHASTLMEALPSGNLKK